MPRHYWIRRWNLWLFLVVGTEAIDFAVVPTATIGIVYVFFVPSLKRRRVLDFNVSRPPTAEWTAQRVVEACQFGLPGRFLIRDQ